MKKIIFSKPFRNSYKERIATYPFLIKLFHNKMKGFMKNRSNPDFYDHPLEGKMEGYRSFSIGFDLRIIYRENPKSLIFIDIGTHHQVYRS